MQITNKEGLQKSLMQIVSKLAGWSNKWINDLGLKHFTAFSTKIRHVIYSSGITSTLPLQELLVNTGNVFCISNIPTSNTNGGWAFWLGYTSRQSCRTAAAASLFHSPDLWLGRPKELRMPPTAWSVISGYLCLGSCSNSKKAPSRALRRVLLAVNKWNVTEQRAPAGTEQHVGVLWSDPGLSHHPRAASGGAAPPGTLQGTALCQQRCLKN